MFGGYICLRWLTVSQVSLFFCIPSCDEVMQHLVISAVHFFLQMMHIQCHCHIRNSSMSWQLDISVRPDDIIQVG